ncbi:hypothetical protein, partial [Amycolatopsis magusensis]|uniref:hypothetical protein n=1 Tax=Amycolatopsis magusensis TaxID=882444 RepID=UPI003C2EFE53
MTEANEPVRRLADVRHEIAQLEARLEALRDEQRSLSRRVDAVGSSCQSLETDQSRVRLTPEVRAILREADVPLTRHDIVLALFDRGISASDDSVSASLSYLKSRGWARNASGL